MSFDGITYLMPPMQYQRSGCAESSGAHETLLPDAEPILPSRPAPESWQRKPFGQLLQATTEAAPASATYLPSGQPVWVSPTQKAPGGQSAMSVRVLESTPPMASLPSGTSCASLEPGGQKTPLRRLPHMFAVDELDPAGQK